MAGMNSLVTWIWIVCVALQLIAVDALILNRVLIPEYVKRGDEVTLACVFDLQGKELYTIKWYKDGHEFYRFEPSAERAKKKFPQPGVKVNLTASNETHVHLLPATLRYSGKYMCEVSEEAPKFDTKQGNGTMSVVVFPSQGPEITGARRRYHDGDSVRVNCTCHKSVPVALLSWYINGEEAAVEHLYYYAPVIHDNQLSSITVGLHFHARAHHFRSGSLKLKCVAVLPDEGRPLFWFSQEVSAVGDRPPEVSHVVDSTAPQSGNSSSSCPVCYQLANWIILAVSVYLSL